MQSFGTGHNSGFNVEIGNDMFRMRDLIRICVHDIKGLFKKHGLSVKIGDRNYPVLGRVGMYHTIVKIDDNVEIGDKVYFEVNPINVDSSIRREYK